MLRIRGTYKLLIRFADDIIPLDVDNIQNEICSERRNQVLLSQQVTDSNNASDYRNRRLLSPQDRHGITFTIVTCQEAARFMNLGIVLSGEKTVSLHLLGQEQMINPLIAQHGALWRGTEQLHHGIGHGARGIVQTGIL
jgi:hypothetical protein